MRLINIYTLELREFFADIPPYAILSHRWSDDEISYKDYCKGRRQDSQGYLKVVGFCKWLKGRLFTRRTLNTDLSAKGHFRELRLEDGSTTLDWAWIDTCCIDKRSSAELSEAINSMFDWYANAAICIALLSSRGANDNQSIADSDWWTRGWTLQELLAPDIVIFCDRNWQVLGHKCRRYSDAFFDEERCMCQDDSISASLGLEVNKTITSITSISADYLRNGGFTKITSFHPSAAIKMSWAARRTTMRPEDLAYCLLGLFKVNMPVLYGEGLASAFRRLQLQILDRANDQSLFAFEHKSGAPQYTLFAEHPKYFVNSSGCAWGFWRSVLPIQVKQSMLCIETEVWRCPNWRLLDGRPISIIKLDCFIPQRSGPSTNGSGRQQYELALAMDRCELLAREIEDAPKKEVLTVLYKVNIQEMFNDERPLSQIIPLHERFSCGREMLYIQAF